MLRNSPGSVSSPWAGIRTLEASPAGLGNFTVEQREQGRALLLSWDQPHAPYGIISVHAIHTLKQHQLHLLTDHSGKQDSLHDTYKLHKP